MVDQGVRSMGNQSIIQDGPIWSDSTRPDPLVNRSCLCAGWTNGLCGASYIKLKAHVGDSLFLGWFPTLSCPGSFPERLSPLLYYQKMHAFDLNSLIISSNLIYLAVAASPPFHQLNLGLGTLQRQQFLDGSGCPAAGQFSCQNTTVVTNLCCFEAPGVSLLFALWTTHLELFFWGFVASNSGSPLVCSF